MRADDAGRSALPLITVNLIRSVLWIMWPLAGGYFALCIGIREIRPYWHNGTRFELFSCIGATIAFAGTWIIYALIVTKLVGQRFYGLIYPVAVLGLAVTIIGGWIEFLEEHEDNKRRARWFKKKDHS